MGSASSPATTRVRRHRGGFRGRRGHGRPCCAPRIRVSPVLRGAQQQRAGKIQLPPQEGRSTEGGRHGDGLDRRIVHCAESSSPHAAKNAWIDTKSTRSLRRIVWSSRPHADSAPSGGKPSWGGRPDRGKEGFVQTSRSVLARVILKEDGKPESMVEY